MNPSDTPRVLRMYDIEIYINFFLIKFYTPSTGEFHAFRLNAWTPLDRAGLFAILTSSTLVGFNSLAFDTPILAAALAGWSPEQMKGLTRVLIVPKPGKPMAPWMIERDYGLQMPNWLDQIDLIEVSPGVDSLKAYGGKLHCKKLQDLPIEHTATLTPQQMDEIDEYCGNDLTTTAALYFKFETQIELRRDLTAQYGIDLRSKSDAQIAEAVFRQQFPNVKPPHIAPGTPFYYKIPEYITFRSPQLVRALDGLRSRPFVVIESGGAAPDIDNVFINWADKAERLNQYGQWVTRPKGWKVELIAVGRAQYQMGLGGLHSCEEVVNHVADENDGLCDIDVVSYYPEIMMQQQLYPPQIGPGFLSTFGGWKAGRVAAKRAKKKKQADGEKTKINGTFGKMGSKYSILHAPHLMIQTTITGQLCLLMLIETLEGAGIPIVQANTDGIVTKCPRHLEGLRDLIVAWWERTTGYETERVDYRAIYSRDVNNYMAFKYDGTVKLKGEAFAPPEPVGPSWPNPTNEICVDACIAYILDGTPVETTIRQCSDIRKFVNVRAVAGQGGHWVRPGCEPQYLGKAVRWYYGRGQDGHIAYVKNGNRVAKSEGCKPCMTLPDIMPPDVDYAWYVRETLEKLRSIDL